VPNKRNYKKFEQKLFKQLTTEELQEYKTMQKTIKTKVIG